MIRPSAFSVLAGTFLALSTGILGCGDRGETRKSPASPAVAGASSLLPGTTFPQWKAIKRVVEQPGTIEAHEQTDLFARVPGYVNKVHVDIGQKVEGPKKDAEGKMKKKGQILAEIDVPELRQEANQKKALVRQAEAEVTQTEKAVLAADASIATAKAAEEEAKALQARWESESKRVTKLVESGTLDRQASDEIQNQLKAAEAKVASMKAAIGKAKADKFKALADVDAAKARVDVAKAEVSRLEAILEYATVRAPYDGVITARKVNTGDSVHPAGGKGDLLFTIARLEPVRVVISVPEADVELVQQNSKVTLNIPALRDIERSGVISRTSWALNPGVRTLRVEMDLPNKDGVLRPGMYVYAQIVNDGAETWVLPHAALAKHGAGMACYQIEDGKALRLEVQVGRSDEQYTEVRRWRKSATTAWQDWTGKETIATRAAGLTDGQDVKLAGSGK